MIFQYTCKWIILPSPTGELKTNTRRLVKAGEKLFELTTVKGVKVPIGVLSANGNMKWAIGKSYAVQPGRGKPAIWWREVEIPDGAYEIGAFPSYQIIYAHQASSPDGHETFYDYSGGNEYILRNAGYQPLRIRITDIRREDVRKISEADARAEGFTSSLEFLRVWCGMHDKGAIKASQAGDYLMLGARPAALYDAWALTFEAVR